LEPPLISFNVSHEAQMHAVITAVDRFAVHLLREDQAALSNHFSLPDLTSDEQFDGLPVHASLQGVPILDEALAVLHCTLYAVYEAGDHSIVVGKVVAIEERVAGEPLVYYDRSYRSVGDEVKVSLFSPVNRVSSETS
jgi:flavin reductase (DIM6/NTAB) family NADH-FMN oxidoreductase RutF